MHIGVDFDDVLYPYHHFLKLRLKRRFGLDFSGRRITTFYYDHLPEVRARGISRDQVWEEVQATWREAESHEVSPLLDPDAGPALRSLARRHRVTVVSARSEDALPHVVAFLKRHRIQPHDVQLNRWLKSGFDVLVDDFPKHALENAQAGGYSLLYTIDENSTFDDSRHPRVLRVRSWDEVRSTVALLDERRRSGA